METAKCEGQIVDQEYDGNGKPLPPNPVACNKPANFVVTRHFSNITQRLCVDHAQRFAKDQTGAFTVAGVK